MKLRTQVVRNSEGMILILDGILDETCELPDFDSDYRGPLLIDMGKLTMINSLGCRKWIQWVRSHPPGVTISLVRCSSVIVNQINILSGFVPPGATVESMYVPYFCAQCGSDEQVLIEVGALKGAFDPDSIPDEKNCLKCGKDMELDVLKARYFGFLTKKLA